MLKTKEVMIKIASHEVDHKSLSIIFLFLLLQPVKSYPRNCYSKFSQRPLIVGLTNKWNFFFSYTKMQILF